MKTLRAALALTVFFLLATGLFFPALVTGIAKAAFPKQASGSLVFRDGQAVGSSLIGQRFKTDRYFHPRPSAAGAGYDANNSSGTNLGPNHPKLLKGAEGFDGVEQLAHKYRQTNGIDTETEIPADAVTRSASGLDPHISVRNAELQCRRVAAARNVPEETLRTMVKKSIEPGFLGVFGEPRVNVLLLNLQLDDLQSHP